MERVVKVKERRPKVKPRPPQKSQQKDIDDLWELERAFKEYKNEDDAFKIRLVYFSEVMLIKEKSNVVVNLDYLYLVEDMDRFNRSWCAISFEQL